MLDLNNISEDTSPKELADLFNKELETTVGGLKQEHEEKIQSLVKKQNATEYKSELGRAFPIYLDTEFGDDALHRATAQVAKLSKDATDDEVKKVFQEEAVKWQAFKDMNVKKKIGADQNAAPNVDGSNSSGDLNEEHAAEMRKPATDLTKGMERAKERIHNLIERTKENAGV